MNLFRSHRGADSADEKHLGTRPGSKVAPARPEARGRSFAARAREKGEDASPGRGPAAGRSSDSTSPFDYLFAPPAAEADATESSQRFGLPPELLKAAEAVLGIPIPGIRVDERPALEAQGLHAVARDPELHVSPKAPSASTAAGRELLGHEFAHIAQQRRGQVPSGDALYEAPSLEAEADRLGTAIAARAGRGAVGSGVPQASATGDGAQREGQIGAASPRAGAAPQPQRDPEAERMRGEGQEELGRRAPPPTQAQADGSGAWGAEQATFTDHANRMFWYGVASAAEAMGLTNAARHMRHYLDSSGAVLRANGDLMLRGSPNLSALFDREVAALQAAAEDRLQAMPQDLAQAFSLEGGRRGHYFRRAESADWFFAVGGCTAWVTGEVLYVPPVGGVGEGWVELDVRLHVFDRYNWDQGKAVSLAGVTVKDEQLGRLHQVGLAKEYPILARSGVKRVRWSMGAAPQSTEVVLEPEARAGEGGRADPGRGDAEGDTERDGGREDE